MNVDISLNIDNVGIPTIMYLVKHAAIMMPGKYVNTAGITCIVNSVGRTGVMQVYVCDVRAHVELTSNGLSYPLLG